MNMNLSFYDLQNEISYLIFKMADDSELLNKRKGSLFEIKQLFDTLNVGGIEDSIRAAIGNYRDKIEAKSLAEALDFDDNVFFNFLKNYSDKIRRAYDNLNNLLSDDAKLSNNKEFLLELKKIRDDLAYDIDVSGRKRINSYFENNFKFLNQSQITTLSTVIIKIQNEISNLWKNYIEFGRSEIYRDIINNPNYNIESNIDAGKQELRDVDISGGKLLTSHLHTLATTAGGTVESKNLPYYLQSPALYDSDFNTLTKGEKFNALNLIFSELDIGFRDIEHLKNKYYKLEAYSQITGDNKLFQNFLLTLRNVNRTSIDRRATDPLEEFKRKITKESSFQELKSEKIKLKTIFRLKLNPTTLERLKNYKIIQRGSECNFVSSPNTSPIMLSNNSLSAISSEMAKSSFNKYYQKYFSLIK